MNSIKIKNYLMLFKNDNSLIHKRNKKKLSKKYIFKRVNFELVKYNNDSNILNCLKKYLINIRKTTSSLYGVILDTNIIIHDITTIPPVPSTYDILCLESEIKSYKNATDSSNSIYWTKTEILNTGNFIVNYNSIDKILDIIHNSKTLTEFYNKINVLNVYSITQTQFSEKQKNYVHDPLIINKNLTDKDKLSYEKNLSIKFYNKFKDIFSSTNNHLTNNNLTNNHLTNNNLTNNHLTNNHLTNNHLTNNNLTNNHLTNNHLTNNVPNISDNLILKTHLLPKVSLICPFTTKELLFHNILTFLRLDYPRHLLELVIINDTKLESELNLPEDSRIKLINLNNKNGSIDSFGYKLNIGVKYATNELIMHFFDTSNYTLNLKRVISYFVLSNKQCLLSNDTGVYQKGLNKSLKISLPDLSNCIYTKDFWKKASFEEVSHKFYINCDLTYKWIHSRLHEVLFIPFIYLSFKIPTKSDIQIDYFEKQELYIDLSNLIDKKIKESFELL